MSNMIKMRNVGAQTQKKCWPGGPPLEGRGGRRVEPGGMGARSFGGPERWGPDLEKVRAPRVGGPGGPTFRAFFSLSRHHFRSFCIWGPAEGGPGQGVQRRGVSGGGNEKNQKI